MALLRWESQHRTHSAVYILPSLGAVSVYERRLEQTFSTLSGPPCSQSLSCLRAEKQQAAAVGFTAVPDKFCQLSSGNPFTFFKFTHASFPKEDRLGLGGGSSIAPASDLNQKNSSGHFPQLQKMQAGTVWHNMHDPDEVDGYLTFAKQILV